MPNHGFHIIDSQLLMRFISLLAYADIFLRYDSGEETHAPQSPYIKFHPSTCKIDEIYNFVPNGKGRARTYDTLVNSQLLCLLSYIPKTEILGFEPRITESESAALPFGYISINDYQAAAQVVTLRVLSRLPLNRNILFHANFTVLYWELQTSLSFMSLF